MTSQTLREARKYEEASEKMIKKEERPDFHLSTRTGWMNDPNGFSYYDGQYHMFYQYYPYETRWGSMHWGHAVSKNLLHWEYLPAALAPDEAYDRDGCFSGSGQILLYTSPDGFQWNFKSVLVSNHNRFGKMWECPDFFELDGKWVLLTSPQDMLPEGFEYHNGNGTLCMIGEYDEETGTFSEHHDQAIDYGIDFYAPQTVLTPDGRRVMIGWMQNWDACSLRSPEEKWFGQMSLPRELSIKDGRLYQRPVRELDEMRRNKVEYHNVTFSDVISLNGVRGRKVDMELTLRPGEGEKLYQKFALRFAQDEKYQTAISFRPHESVLKVDRKFSGSRRAIIHQRRSLVNSTNGELKMRVILDRFSVEVFVNDGEHVLTATMYTDQSADGISFFADGTVNMDVVKYDLV